MHFIIWKALTKIKDVDFQNILLDKKSHNDIFIYLSWIQNLIPCKSLMYYYYQIKGYPKDHDGRTIIFIKKKLC